MDADFGHVLKHECKTESRIQLAFFRMIKKSGFRIQCANLGLRLNAETFGKWAAVHIGRHEIKHNAFC